MDTLVQLENVTKRYDLNAAGQTLIIVTRSAELTRRHARRVIHLADGQVALGPAGRGGETEGA